MAFRFKESKVYKDSKLFYKFCLPFLEGINDHNLCNQITRALNSIVLNIAEGSADNSDIEFARFLGISIRSIYEVVAGFDIAYEREEIDVKMLKDVEEKAEELVKQLSAFRNTLKKAIG